MKCHLISLKNVILGIVSLLCASTGMAGEIGYGDGTSDGKQSFGGSGHAIKFTMPDDQTMIKGVKLFCSRYGLPKPPKEDFELYFMNEDMKDSFKKEKAPYKLIKRDDAQWYEVKFKESFKAPKTFWLIVNFNATANKGVCVHYDSSTGGKYSKIGMPGAELQDFGKGGDWMIKIITDK